VLLYRGRVLEKVEELKPRLKADSASAAFLKASRRSQLRNNLLWKRSVVTLSVALTVLAISNWRSHVRYKAEQNFKRLDVRVPAVSISPYIEPGTIDNTVYDHTSVIATARKLFLGNSAATSYLTQRDRLAVS
jgi:hypothetical protein